jgi:hypothetical protein
MKQSGRNFLIFSLLMLLVPSISRAVGEIIIPEGTRITLQLNDTLSTKYSKEGDAFKALVMNPVYQGEKIVISKGSVVAGSISRIIRPGRFGANPKMNLLFQSINIPGHGEYQIVADLERVNSDNSGEHSEGTVKGKGSTGRDIGKVLTPTLAGAGIGGIAGGGKGAGIGVGIGAVVGIATIFSTPGKDLELSRGSTLDILLVKPLSIPADSDNVTEKIR